MVPGYPHDRMTRYAAPRRAVRVTRATRAFGLPSTTVPNGPALAPDGSGLTNTQEDQIQQQGEQGWGKVVANKQITLTDYEAMTVGIAIAIPGVNLVVVPILLAYFAAIDIVFAGLVAIWGNASAGAGQCAKGVPLLPTDPAYSHYADHNATVAPVNAFETFMQPMGQVWWESQTNCGPLVDPAGFLAGIVAKWNTYHDASQTVVYDSSTMSIFGEKTLADVATAQANFGTGNPTFWPDPLGMGDPSVLSTWFTSGNQPAVLYTVNLGPLTSTGVAAAATANGTPVPAAATTSTATTAVAVVGGVAAATVLGTALYAYVEKQSYAAVWRSIWSKTGGKILGGL